MLQVEFRKAEREDCVWAGERLLETLYGFGPYLMGMGDQDRASKALSDYFYLRDNRFSYQFAYIAEVAGKPAGLLLNFPGLKLLRANLFTSVQMFSVYRLAEIAEHVWRMIKLRDEEEVGKDELYIAHLAVSPQYRQQGIGHKMLEYAQKLTLDEGMKKLALMAEIDNDGAIALYKRFGFSVIKEFIHPHQVPLTGSHGYVRMVKEI